MTGEASPPMFSISSVMVISFVFFEQVIVRVRMSFSAKICAWRMTALTQILSSSMSQEQALGRDIVDCAVQRQAHALIRAG